MEPNRSYIEDRIQVGGLIRAVLLGKLTVLEALKTFPKRQNDPSINAAFHAIVHYEADEDLRKSDPLYAQEQDDYLLELAQTLTKGESLPINIISQYLDFHDNTLIYPKMNKKSIFDRLKKMINF